MLWETSGTAHWKPASIQTFDSNQFNSSTDDAINIALHTALSHLVHFIDYSAFNTIILGILVDKLYNLDFPHPPAPG